MFKTNIKVFYCFTFFYLLFIAVALQGDSREVVAVKVVGKKTLNKASTENLLTEIEILKTVKHPHVVQLKDFQARVSQRYFINLAK